MQVPPPELEHLLSRVDNLEILLVTVMGTLAGLLIGLLLVLRSLEINFKEFLRVFAESKGFD